MKRLPLIALLAALVMPAFADDQSGFWIGAGAAATTSDDCDYCDTSGHVIELGFDIISALSVEAKLGDTSYDDGEGDLEFKYLGLNAGTDFGTRWVKLYGKIGMIDATESVYDYEYSDSSAAFGIGVRFTPFAHQRGFYIKLEPLRSKFEEFSYGAGILAVGFKI